MIKHAILVMACLSCVPFWRGGEAKNFPKGWDILRSRSFGMKHNVSTPKFLSGPFYSSIRIYYRKGSFSPSKTKQLGRKVGGAQFYSEMDHKRDHVFLRYCVRFAKNFKFIKGGKLPGLYGGSIYTATGGRIPDGTNGWSTRFMWGRKGKGYIYAYLPTSKTWGTSIGGNWKFKPGVWHLIQQEVKLNTPRKTNGIIRVWFDKKLVVERKDIQFRTTKRLSTNGILFSTFFGGGHKSWATPVDTFADFAGFALGTSKLNPPKTRNNKWDK